MSIDELEKCQICGSRNMVGLRLAPTADPRREAMGAVDNVSWCFCSECSFVFQNPRPSLKSQEEFYTRSGFREGGELINQGYIEFAPHQLARFLPWLNFNEIKLEEITHGNCLDYGCGIGGALSFMAQLGNKNWGVELDKALSEFGNTNYPIEIVPTVDDLPGEIQFNLIFANHALEHVYDPNELFEFASRRLTEGGVVLVAVPSWRYANTASSLNGFDSTDNSMFDHVSLSRLMNKHGFLYVLVPL